jgi:hypothetical protein
VARVPARGGARSGAGGRVPTLPSRNDAGTALVGLQQAARQLWRGLPRLKEGLSSSVMGRATLVAGTVVVTTSAVTSASEIFLTTQVPGGTAGALRVSARTPGTSFTVQSTSGTDTGTFAWLILEPA